MRIRFLAPLALAASVAMVTPAFAKTDVPTVEPMDSILTRGQAPSWQAQHTEGTQFPELHREWHKQKASELAQWNTMWASKKDTLEYAKAQRDFYRKRDFAHRMYHAPIVEKSEVKETVPTKEDLSVDLPEHSLYEGEFEGKIVPWPTASRWYQGNRPSRRTIVETKEKMERLKVGN